MPKDRRSPLAKARDEWFESDEGDRCLNPVNFLLREDQVQSLRNRLERAFLAGANAQLEIGQQ